jgi:hypothetical protein
MTTSDLFSRAFVGNRRMVLDEALESYEVDRMRRAHDRISDRWSSAGEAPLPQSLEHRLIMKQRRRDSQRRCNASGHRISD